MKELYPWVCITDTNKRKATTTENESMGTAETVTITETPLKS